MNIIQEVELGLAFSKAIQDLVSSGKLQEDYQHLTVNFEKAKALIQEGEALYIETKAIALSIYTDLEPQIKALLAHTQVNKA